MTVLEKKYKDKRLHALQAITGHKVKSVKESGYSICIMFEDDTFIVITADHTIDDGIDFSYNRYLDAFDYFWLGIIDEKERDEAIKRQEQARKNSEEARDKKEYERLKKKYEGK